MRKTLYLVNPFRINFKVTLNIGLTEVPCTPVVRYIKLGLKKFELHWDEFQGMPMPDELAIKAELRNSVSLGINQTTKKNQILVWIPVSSSVDFDYCVLPYCRWILKHLMPRTRLQSTHDTNGIQITTSC